MPLKGDGARLETRRWFVCVVKRAQVIRLGTFRSSAILVPAERPVTAGSVFLRSASDTTAELIDDESFNQQCLNSEAKADRHVRALWAETPDSVRAVCVKHSELFAPSYQSLSACMATMVGDMWMNGELKVVPR